MHGTATQIPLFSETDEPDETSPGFSVRESGRARRLSIKVYPRGKVEVVVPKRTRARDVQAFVAEHRDWIRKTRESFAALHAPEPFRLPATIALPGIGRVYRVQYERNVTGSRVRFRQRGDLLVLSGATADTARCVDALKRWLANVAKRELAPRLRAEAALTGTAFRRLRVAGQKTCWGSHSSTGTISLNYCVLFLRPELVRYLMVHELCHARHMNHSRRFWALVRRFEPDYRRLDRELSDSWRSIPTWVGIY